VVRIVQVNDGRFGARGIVDNFPSIDHSGALLAQSADGFARSVLSHVTSS
jgi:hypothetical protein